METLQETDLYWVRLSTYLWLLVPAVLGIAVGAGLAHRSFNDAPVSAAPAHLSPGLHPAAPLPPARRYRPASTRSGLSPLRSESQVMQSAVQSASMSAIERRKAAAVALQRQAAAAVGGPVVIFNTRRAFSEEVGGTDTTTTGTFDTSTTPAAPANTTPIVISDVHTTSLTPFSSTIAFHTSEAVNTQVAYGIDAETLWTSWDTASQDHVAVVDGVSPNMTYRVWVNAHSTDGRTASSPFFLTTPPTSGTVTGGTGAGAFQLNGQAYFPFVVWGACPDSYDREFAAGIDLFLSGSCGDSAKQLGALAGHGYLVTDAMNGTTPGAVGSYLPDEWDTHLPNNLTSAQVQGMIPQGAGGPRFLTLTNHFYSNAAPLPQGRGMYPALAANADVLGFDLYPLQNWCRYDEFDHVFNAQRELVQLAAGKPTFQWIEARGNMDCHDPSLDPNAATVHAETWLSIAGGAHAVGYFPYDFPADIGDQIARDKHDIQGLVPALLDSELQASVVGQSTVKVGARAHNGAVYVIAVNSSREATTATINVASLGDRPLTSLDRTRFVTPQNGSFQDTFGPLDVHIYIAAPVAP